MHPGNLSTERRSSHKYRLTRFEAKLFFESFTLLDDPPTQVSEQTSNQTKNRSHQRTHYQRQNAEINSWRQGLESFDDIGIMSDIGAEKDRMDDRDPGAVQYAC